MEVVGSIPTGTTNLALLLINSFMAIELREHTGKLTTIATIVPLILAWYVFDGYYARATTVEDVETKVVAVEDQVKIVNRHMFNLLQVLKTQWITRKTVLEYRKQQGDNLTPAEKVELKNVTELLETLSQKKSETVSQ
ncbi:hypothetical protein LCGC14_1193520 [marine sediment metagenome]|uniref:Uncharacterized protein n=1 Tax=marine sediment metagenome TaxID=412755 RepID=A0A0F9M6H4_9ZZZZ